MAKIFINEEWLHRIIKEAIQGVVNENKVKEEHRALSAEELRKYGIVYAGQYPMKLQQTADVVDFSALPVTSIVRGCVHMQSPAYSRKRDSIPLIHTTNIQKGKLVDMKKFPCEHLKVDGFGVVIPRVCNPNPGKIALLDGSQSYALSDCVIVLRTDTMEAAKRVRTHILNNLQDFITLYKGTGAQYTTLARVKRVFGKC